MPTISVVVPVCNGERTILETIVSVQQQTYSDFELIVINDGSTDRTLDLLSTVKDLRLKVFSYDNGGLPVARNRGIAQASGEFISFIDADDLWTPDKLELQLEALRQHPEAGVAYSWTRPMSEHGEDLHASEPLYFEGNVYADLLAWNFIGSGSNVLIRREAIEATGEFDPTLRSCEDWDYWLRLAPRWPFVVVPKPQILYRLSSGAMSAKVEVMEKSKLAVIERAFRSAPPELQFLKNQSLANAHLYWAKLCLTHVSGTDGAKRSREKLQQAIRLHPQVLLQKKAQVLLIKLLLIGVLSPKVAQYFLKKISKARATPNELVI